MTKREQVEKIKKVVNRWAKDLTLDDVYEITDHRYPVYTGSAAELIWKILGAKAAKQLAAIHYLTAKEPVDHLENGEITQAEAQAYDEFLGERD